jgi:hypothetical protein
MAQVDELGRQRQAIEKMRWNLHQLVASRQGNFTHPDVMQLSASLDHLIVDYQLLMKRQGNDTKYRR